MFFILTVTPKSLPLHAAARFFLSTDLSLMQTQPGSSTCSEILLFWWNSPLCGMQFNPAAGKVHAVVPPGHGCYRIPPWLPVFPTCLLCWVQQRCWMYSTAQLSHHTKSINGTTVENSKQEAELGTQGLHNGLLTQHHPSCSLQKECINSS